jgi:tetratricopeptide (TPR) repeat protein
MAYNRAIMRPYALRWPITLTIVTVVAAVATAQPATPPDPAALTAQARKLTVAGKTDEAVALFTKALAADPSLFEAHLGLGIALDLQGKYKPAREHLTRAVALSTPNTRASALSALAVSYAFEGLADEAAQVYQKQFDQQVADEAFDSAAATANAIGRVYLETGNLTQAAQWYRTGYETARKLSGLPADQVDLWEMRWLHAQSRLAARRGNPVEAARHAAALKRLIDKGGENAKQLPIHHYLVGYNALVAGELPAAVSALSAADQGDPFILGLLAQVHLKQGDKARAYALRTQALASTAHNLQHALTRVAIGNWPKG